MMAMTTSPRCRSCRLVAICLTLRARGFLRTTLIKMWRDAHGIGIGPSREGVERWMDCISEKNKYKANYS